MFLKIILTETITLKITFRSNLQVKISTRLAQHLNWLQCLLHMSFGISSKQKAAGPWMQTDERTRFTYVLTPKWSRAITIWISAHSFDWGWTIAVVHFNLNEQTNRQTTSKQASLALYKRLHKWTKPTHHLPGHYKTGQHFQPSKHNSYS